MWISIDTIVACLGKFIARWQGKARVAVVMKFFRKVGFSLCLSDIVYTSGVWRKVEIPYVTSGTTESILEMKSDI